MIEKIYFQNKVISILVRNSFQKEGIEFFTPNSYSQQIGYMKRNKGHIIEPHVHTTLPREVSYTQEVLFIKSGKVRVDFYSDEQVYLESKILEAGDFILLAFGGHGLEIIEESEIIEVKQGPYCEDKDKIRFSTSNKEIIIK